MVYVCIGLQTICTFNFMCDVCLQGAGKGYFMDTGGHYVIM